MITFLPQESFPTAIRLEKNFLSDIAIDKFFKFIKDLPYKEAEIHSQEDTDNHRSSKIKWIPHEDPFIELYFKCRDYIGNQNSYHWKFDIDSGWENFQYTEYRSDTKGHYDWHVDIGPTFASYRKLSMVIQLSNPEEYEGGDLQLFDPIASDENFPYKSVPKKKGSIIVFPSFLPHRVTPVTGGIRKSLVWWVGGDHLR